MVANLPSPETQHPGSPSSAPPAPPRPRPRAAPRSPRPPGLAGLAAHHPRARPELRRSCLGATRKCRPLLLGALGWRCEERSRRSPQLQPAAPAEAPSGPGWSPCGSRISNHLRSPPRPSPRPQLGPPRSLPTDPARRPRPPPSKARASRRPPTPGIPQTQPTPSPPQRRPRALFRPSRPPAARPRYREYGGGGGESGLGPKRANRSLPQVPRRRRHTHSHFRHTRGRIFRLRSSELLSAGLVPGSSRKWPGVWLLMRVG